MTNFNWAALLNRYHISYNTRGPNTPRLAVSTHCPFCGPADPSDHMVLWPNGGWRCWRNPTKHSGRAPTYLIQALTGCSLQEAASIAGAQHVQLGTDLSKVAAMLTPTVPVTRTLTMPKEFRPFADEWACQPYIEYLRGRPGGFEFEPSYLYWRYGIHYCLRGPFRGRIIFPVYHKGKLVSYTGRTIWSDAKERYKSLTTDTNAALAQGLEPALGPINNYLPWYDNLITKPSHTLVLCEGPPDALKVNLIGTPDVVSTCWLGAEPTNAQIELLHTVSHNFSHKFIFSDEDMPQKAHRIAWRLHALGFKAAPLPKDIGDPAEFHTRDQLLKALNI